MQSVVTAFKSLPMPSMPSPGGCSSVGEAPSLSFSPLPVGTYAIDFPKEPAEADARPCMGHAITSPPPVARSLAVGGNGPPAMWTHAKEPLRRCVLTQILYFPYWSGPLAGLEPIMEQVLEVCICCMNQTYQAADLKVCRVWLSAYSKPHG